MYRSVQYKFIIINRIFFFNRGRERKEKLIIIKINRERKRKIDWEDSYLNTLDLDKARKL